MARSTIIVLLVMLLIRCASPGHADVQPQKIIGWFNIGYSSRHEGDRMVGRQIKKTGWKGFVDGTVREQLAAGVRRFQLHNPFGARPNQSMQFDQFLHARDGGFDWLYADFLPAWKPVILGKYTDGEPVEVIAYLGSLDKGKKITQLVAAGDVEGYLTRALASIQLVRRAGMSIGFDSLGGRDGVVEHDPAYRFVALLESLDVRVYIEPRPHKEHVHLHRFNIITLDEFWRTTEVHPAASQWIAPKEQLTGEIVRILRRPYKNTNWIDSVRRVLRDGHSCAIPFHRLPQGTTVADLIRKDESD